MEVFSIPVAGKYIIYRPLRQLAFVGNQAMAGLAQRLATEASIDAGLDAYSRFGVPEDVLIYLRNIGFLGPDPPQPLAPDRSYRPSTAVLLVTNRCHLRCVYCYANGGVGTTQALTLEMARSVIDHALANALSSDRPAFEVAFHGGGEPVTAWSLLQQATVQARSKPLPCFISLTSNGIWSERQAKWIVENLDSVSLSIDGAPATQDRQRPFVSGRGSSDIVMRTITYLDKAGFNYGIRMTAMPPWEERLPVDVQFLCEHTACRSIQVEPAVDGRRGQHKAPTVDEAMDFAGAFISAFDVARQAGRRLVYTGARPWLLTQSFCTAPYNAIIVNPAGELVSCYEVTDPAHPLVDLSHVGRSDGCRVAIDHAGREALLDRIDERRSHCHACFCRWHCAGDCYVRTFSADGCHTSFGARCEMNRAITAQLLLRYISDGDGVWQGQEGQSPRSAC